MGEEAVIGNSGGSPATGKTLRRDLERGGIVKGMTLIVHSSMSSLGWVCGGAQTVIQVLEDILTEEGTLIMPAHSGDLSDPANWGNPPVPESWWETIRREMPPFSRDLTPTRGMGRIAETFRKQDGVRRSGHPQYSFAAWGKNRDYILQDEKYEYAMDMKSPLGRIYELGGSVLLLGVGHSNNTSIHLAEYLADWKGKKIVRNGMPVPAGSGTVWREFEEIEYDTDDFDRIGAAYEEATRTGGIAIAVSESRLMNQRDLVDFSVKWMEKNR